MHKILNIKSENLSSYAKAFNNTKINQKDKNGNNC